MVLGGTPQICYTFGTAERRRRIENVGGRRSGRPWLEHWPKGIRIIIIIIIIITCSVGKI
jgi:hypothetical protein